VKPERPRVRVEVLADVGPFYNLGAGMRATSLLWPFNISKLEVRGRARREAARRRESEWKVN